MFKNCIIKSKGIAPGAYHASNGKRGDRDFVMSPSALKRFAECPAEWIAAATLQAKFQAKLDAAQRPDERRYWKRMIENLDPDSREQSWGRLVDARLFTPDKFKDIYAVRPREYAVKVLECPECGSITEAKTCRNCKTERVEVEQKVHWSSRSTACQDWIDDHEKTGLEVISPYLVESADLAIERMMADPIIRKAVECSDKQIHVVGEWHDKATDLVIPVQCLIDIVPRLDTEYVPDVEMQWPKLLGDMKLPANIELLDFNRRVQRFGWHIQGAFDLKLYTEATGEDRTSWIFFGQKNCGAWQPYKRLMVEDFKTLGTAAYQRMLSNYCWCLKNNKWPDYDDTDESISGFGLAAPDAWMAEREQFAPRFNFEDEESEPEEPFQVAEEDIPT